MCGDGDRRRRRAPSGALALQALEAIRLATGGDGRSRTNGDEAEAEDGQPHQSALEQLLLHGPDDGPYEERKETVCLEEKRSDFLLSLS